MDQGQPLWRDRHEAGAALALRLVDLAGQGDHTTLVALPRGGIAVAAAMADVLALPLCTWAVRKLAHSWAQEVAIGAVAPGGVILWEPTGGRLLDSRQQAELVAQQQRELLRRQRMFGDPNPQALKDRHLVVVDDGIATGLTVRAALISLRQLQPASLTLAVPVVDRQLATGLAAMVDRFEALALVDHLQAVGGWYAHFEQLSDDDVLRLLSPGCRHPSTEPPEPQPEPESTHRLI